MQVETGDQHTASWQFTIELSELWQKKFPEADFSISPSYTSGIKKRFENLEHKNSRLVIAPLDSTANQIIRNHPVKLAAVLWEVFVVPIDIGINKKPISLKNYRYWYISEKSVIIPKLMQDLNKPYFSEMIRNDFKNRIPLGNNLEKTAEEVSRQPLYNLSQIDSEEDSLIFGNSAQVAGLTDFKTEILQIKNDTIQEIISEYREGILFFEMIGPIQALESVLEKKLTTTYFSKNIQDFLVSMHPWIHPVYKRRAGLKTLGFNMALFVHYDEDPEFVKSIIMLLSEQPQSEFPPSFIFDNLSIQKTKEISPFFIHAGSLDYFNLD
ncbi:MAG: hypothetical protein HQ517_17060 [SAR324 cluster bacterium]|nr:hypothetical protein [SAR324 cluster bacterium]